MSELRRTLASVPEVRLTEDVEVAVGDSVRFLGSDAALRSLALDPYWPKWESPWWHMLALWELGEAQRIPHRAVAAMIDALNALPLKIFPHRREEMAGADLLRDCVCHCALGSVQQVLVACGVDVAAALPWSSWYARYQMADGGLSCDSEAYLVAHECPSSMVATVAPFEAMLLGPWTPERRSFLARAAGFLIERKLMLGSSSLHNAEERDAQADWLLPCFPRFYFYDVLRGLAALVRWAALGGGALPVTAIRGAIEHLTARSPDGVIRIGRHGFETAPTTLRRSSAGAWVREPTRRFPLLDAISAIGAPSATLTRQWTETRRALIALIDDGRVVGALD